MSATSSARALRNREDDAIVAGLMEPLRLFSPEAIDVDDRRSSAKSADPSEPTLLVPHEYLAEAERFLEDRFDVDAELATVEAAMFLCEGAGDIRRGTLEALRVDNSSYPRSAAAVDRTRSALALGSTSWPDGFWPRFLLGILAEG